MNHHSPFIRLALVVLAVSIPLAAAAQPVGRGIGVGTTIEWPTNVSGHDRILVRVSTPYGDVVSKEFGPGQPLTLRISDLGTEVPDGQYNYEFIIVPKINSGLAKKLDAARAANDDAAARKALRDAGIVPQSASGAFQILNGSIISSSATEGGAAAEDTSASLRDREAAPSQPSSPSTRGGKVGVNDQVIPDDLIVQGSTCVGLDCVNNESFGFDTIRMKENNTRVKFEDTSSTSGFPTNDWQLTANDSASGGSSKFSIEDITGAKVPFTVTAGASTNSIFVDSTGRVGFRTSTPVLDLHVATSNTPALRLEQNNSGGFTAQTWDIAGNEANFFVRDVTGGSKLSLRIRPGAPTSSLDISADGDIGMGTASPEADLHVFGTNTADVFIGVGPDPLGNNATPESALTIGYAGSSFGQSAGFFNVRPGTGATAPNPSLRFLTANTQAMIIDNQQFIGIGTTANPDSPIHYTNGATQARLTTAGVWQDASSRDAKDNIQDLDAPAALQALLELKPVTYTYKVLPTDPKVGFIAEDVPEIVATPERQNLSALDIVAVVTKVVQEQQKTIEQLNERIAQLERERQQ